LIPRTPPVLRRETRREAHGAQPRPPGESLLTLPHGPDAREAEGPFRPESDEERYPPATIVCRCEEARGGRAGCRPGPEEAHCQGLAALAGCSDHETVRGETGNSTRTPSGTAVAATSQNRAISQTGLAQLLAPFEIGPKQLGGASRNPRGYDKSDFKDAFDRYVGVGTAPTDEIASLLSRYKPHGSRAISKAVPATVVRVVAASGPPKPLSDQDSRP
jgi:hypothetical protein